jgi:Signal recognition particle receptor beta subunit
VASRSSAAAQHACVAGPLLVCGLRTAHSSVQGRAVQLVDVPGHPRMAHVFEERVPAAAGVVFVIDAAGFVRRKGEIARWAPLSAVHGESSGVSKSRRAEAYCRT